jgi:glycosyltransferase involved in cell wall biosynthesis
MVKVFQVTTVPITLTFYREHFAYLQANGFEPAAVSSPDPELWEFQKAFRLPVHALPMTRTISPAADLVSLYRLFHLFRRERPQIVHATTPKAGLLAPPAARAAGVPVVVVSLFGLAQMTKTGGIKKLLDTTTRFSCKLADLVWCDSFSMREHIIREQLCADRKLVVLGAGSVNGIDGSGRFNPDSYPPARRRELRAGLGIPADAVVIGFVGRIVGDKGIRELTAVWRELRESHPQLHLLLVGPFEAKDPLPPDDEQCLKNDSRVHLTGWRTDIPDLFAVMDLFVNPSYREGFGVANLEAAAMRLPVVSTCIPGCVDSVADGINGILVPPRDAATLKKALETYLTQPERRRSDGQAGRERVLRDFQPERLCRELAAHYRRLLRRNSTYGMKGV